MERYELQSLFDLISYLERQGIPKADFYKYIPKFIEMKSRRNHYPIHGVFELTPLCNFDCKMCYIHIGKDQLNINDLLPISLWKKLAYEAHEAGLKSLGITGGECLTYPDFDELYAYLVTLGLSVAVMTNGYFIDQKRRALFKKYRPYIIQVSLYGSSEERYEAVTGVRAFNRVYQNIINLRDDGQRVRLAITPSIYMKDVKELVRLAEDLGLKYGINPKLTQPRENTGRTRVDLSTEEYLEIYRFISSSRNEVRKQVNWSEVPDTNHVGIQRYGIRCGSGRSTFGIRYDGLMCPCLSLSHIIAKPLEIGFEPAWRQINNAAEQFQLPLECGDCLYRWRCLSCVAIHKDAPVKGHCDPQVCDRMKRLVHEGFIPLQDLC